MSLFLENAALSLVGLKIKIHKEMQDDVKGPVPSNGKFFLTAPLETTGRTQPSETQNAEF